MSCRAQIWPKISRYFLWFDAGEEHAVWLRTLHLNTPDPLNFIQELIQSHEYAQDDLTYAINFLSPKIDSSALEVRKELYQSQLVYFKTASLCDIVVRRKDFVRTTTLHHPKLVKNIDHYLLRNSYFLKEMLAPEVGEFLNQPFTHFFARLWQDLKVSPKAIKDGFRLELEEGSNIVHLYELYQRGPVLNRLQLSQAGKNWHFIFVGKPGYYVQIDKDVVRLPTTVIPPLISGFKSYQDFVKGEKGPLAIDPYLVSGANIFNPRNSILPARSGHATLITREEWVKFIRQHSEVLNRWVTEYQVLKQKPITSEQVIARFWKDLSQFQPCVTLKEMNSLFRQDIVVFVHANLEAIRSRWPLELACEYYHPRRRFFFITHNYTRPVLLKNLQPISPILKLYLQYAPETKLLPIDTEMYLVGKFYSGLMHRADLANYLGKTYNPLHDPCARDTFTKVNAKGIAKHAKRLDSKIDLDVIHVIKHSDLSLEDKINTVGELVHKQPILRTAQTLKCYFFTATLLLGYPEIFIPQCNTRSCVNTETPVEMISTAPRPAVIKLPMGKFVQCLNLNPEGVEVDTEDPRGLMIAWGTLDNYLGMTLGEVLDTFKDLLENGPYIFYTPWREHIPDGFEKTFGPIPLTNLRLICSWLKDREGMRIIKQLASRKMEVENKAVFLKTYNALTDKHLFHRYLYLLFFVGMYCRRWRGPGYDYPYSFKNGNIPFLPDTVVAKLLGELYILGEKLPILEQLSIYELTHSKEEVKLQLKGVGQMQKKIRQTLGLDGEPECFRTMGNFFLATGIVHLENLGLVIPGFDRRRLQSFAIVAPEESSGASYEEAAPASFDFTALKLDLPTISP